MAERRTVYQMLKEATHMADVIEASESGYISLDDKSIHELEMQLLYMIDRIREAHSKKVSGAATPETVSTYLPHTQKG